MVTRDNVKPDVDGFHVGSPERMVALPSPVPDVVNLAIVSAYLSSKGLDPNAFREYLEGISA